MKTKHLFTLFVLLASTGFSIFLPDVSVAEKNAPSTTNRPKNPGDDKPIPASTNEKGVPGSTSTTSPTNNDTSELTPAVTSTVSPAVSTGDKTKPDDNVLWLIYGLLHLLEIGGIVWAYVRTSKLTQKNHGEINSLREKLSASEKKPKTQEDTLKKIASNTEKLQGLTSRINVLEQEVAQQRNNTVSNVSPLTSSDPVKVAAMTPSPYPFLDIYRRNPDIFKNQYAPEIVSEDADNLRKRRSGDYQEIILGKDRQGNYWLFNDGTITYLIPSPKLKVNDLNIGTAGELFTCENYTSGYQNITVVRPAIVSSQIGANERWKLEQKGLLEFM